MSNTRPLTSSEFFKAVESHCHKGYLEWQRTKLGSWAAFNPMMDWDALLIVIQRQFGHHVLPSREDLVRCARGIAKRQDRAEGGEVLQAILDGLKERG